MDTFGLTPQEQLEHGIGLIRDYELNPQPRYLAAGLASCFTALWRQQEENTARDSTYTPRDTSWTAA